MSPRVFNSFVYALLEARRLRSVHHSFANHSEFVFKRLSPQLYEGGRGWSQFVQRSSQPFQSTIAGDNVEVK